MAIATNPLVLLCDAAFSAVPILFALKRMGYRVAVCGSRPQDPGHQLADLSFVMDYSDRDMLLRTVRDQGVQYLVPGCTDVSYLSCAWVADQLGLPGYDTPASTEIIHRKDKFRELCRANAFPTPSSAASASDVESIGFPLLVKPGDSYSGRGIIKVQALSELAAAIDIGKAESPTASVVLEELVDGKLYSYSAFICGGKVVADFIVNEYCTVHPYQVNSSHLCLGLKNEIVQGLKQWLEAFASLVNLADGLVHTQFISNCERFWLIEVMRRCPGDLYAILVDKSTGIDYAGMFAASFCDSASSMEQKPVRARRFFSRHTVSVNQDCIFLGSRIEVPNATVSFVPLKRTGEVLHAAPLDRAGIYFIEHSSATEMKDYTPRMRNCVSIETLRYD